jgi:hypothetical protein
MGRDISSNRGQFDRLVRVERMVSLLIDKIREKITHIQDLICTQI